MGRFFPESMEDCMSYFPSTPRIDWWKRLADQMHAGTDWRLRRLQIRRHAGEVLVEAIAPDDKVRKNAERIARELIPGDFLRISIRVHPGSTDACSLRNRSANRLAAATDRSSPSIPEVLMYRRCHRLLGGR
jgi:hypothetical protein